MPRQRKVLSLQQGNLPQEQRTEREFHESYLISSNEHLSKVPKILSKEAKKEWKRLVEELRKLDFVSNLDYDNLMSYCIAYDEYLKISEELKSQPKIVEYTNKAGATNFIENPLIKLRLKYSDEKRHYARLLGLSVDSRLKIAAIKTEQIQNEISEMFGDI